MKVQLFVLKNLNVEVRSLSMAPDEFRHVVLRSRKSTRMKYTTFKDYLGILNHVSNKCSMIVALLGV